MSVLNLITTVNKYMFQIIGTIQLCQGKLLIKWNRWKMLQVVIAKKKATQNIGKNTINRKNMQETNKV